ncbi:MAG: hypothetical protein R3C24_00455 [Cyanobacteriota/Melainabacteria group bacterium]
MNNLSDSGAIFGLRNATTDNMLFRGQNLPFQLRPVQPTVRKLYIPEFSDQPMLQVQVNGRSMIIPPIRALMILRDRDRASCKPGG